MPLVARHCSQLFSSCFSSQTTSAFTRAMTTSSSPQDHPFPHACSYETKQKVKTACLPNTSRGTPLESTTHCVILKFPHYCKRRRETLSQQSHLQNHSLQTPRESSSSPFISFVWCKAFAGEGPLQSSLVK